MPTDAERIEDEQLREWAKPGGWSIERTKLAAELLKSRARIYELEKQLRVANSQHDGTLDIGDTMIARLRSADAVVDEARDREHEPFKRKGERRAGHCKLCKALIDYDTEKRKDQHG